MEKTFRFLSMAALLVMGAIMTGCSSDDNIDNPQQPMNNDNVVTLTATVNLDGNAGTRALDPSTGVKTFEYDTTIAVIYKNVDGETKKAESGELTLSDDRTSATFTVSLTNPAPNSAVRYIYPGSFAEEVATDAAITDDDATIYYSGLRNQDGCLHYDNGPYYYSQLAVYDGALSGTELPASATLTNPLVICAFTLTDGTNPITRYVYSMIVSDGTNTYRVYRPGLNNNNPIYVIMKPVSGKITFIAATDNNTYFKTVTGKTLAASKLYPISVSMDNKYTVGQVICSDGSFYATKSAAEEASKTPVAVIASVGFHSYVDYYQHGMAIALADEAPSNWQTAMSTCEGKTAVPGAKWCLPSKGQWGRMFYDTSGAYNSGNYDELNTMITNAGGTPLQRGPSYWTSDCEYNKGYRYYVMYLSTSDSQAFYNWTSAGGSNKCVRACLVF